MNNYIIAKVTRGDINGKGVHDVFIHNIKEYVLRVVFLLVYLALDDHKATIIRSKCSHNLLKECIFSDEMFLVTMHKPCCYFPF